MLHVPPENNEFEGEIIPCSDFRLGTSQPLRLSDRAFDTHRVLSEGIPDSVCDVPLCNNPTPLEAFKEYSKIVIDLNNDSTSSDDDSPYGEDIDFCRLQSLPMLEIVSLGWFQKLSTLDFFTSSDSVAGIVSRCSSSIMRESTGSSVDKTGMIAMV
ncbi:hypothetical protein Tco_0544749 [Tanacetum coccineum]